jgi:ubiquinone/menaquinone biosynthesis C-methylase UbiE
MPDSVATRVPLLEEVQAYWDWYISSIQVAGEEFGSKDFFDSIKVDHAQAYSCANELLNLPRLKGKSLLELGCGIGLDTVEFARHGAEVTAVDVSALALDLARKNLEHNGLQARVEYGNAEELGFKADTFDFVVARGILMFTPDDLRIVNEIFRVLRPGGEAQILLHKRFSWYTLLAKLSRTNLVHEKQDPPVNRLYSVGEAHRLFKKFSKHQIFFGRFPSPSKRKGIFAQAYNRLLIPLTRLLPTAMIRPIGYYMIVKAIK